MTEPTPISRILGYCNHSDAVLSRNVANGGIGMWCDSCRQWVTKEKGYDRLWLGKDHPALAGKDLSQIPDVGLRTYRKCEGPCGELTFCQFHHMSPRAFFGEHCDSWPTAWLCRDCHAKWHTLVTPGLCTAYSPSSHAEQLIGYLGLEKAAELTKALIALGRAKRAGAA